MEKRLFNKLGFETSLLGLGCMRFPQKNGKIDLLETEKLVDAAWRAESITLTLPMYMGMEILKML